MTGKVHLVLREDLESVMEDHYEWNKVTTCVHNLFGGGQRWVDQYGEMIIKNTNKGLTCKMSFVRVSYSANTASLLNCGVLGYAGNFLVLFSLHRVILM